MFLYYLFYVEGVSVLEELRKAIIEIVNGCNNEKILRHIYLYMVAILGKIK